MDSALSRVVFVSGILAAGFGYAADKPLIVHGDVQVTASDFDAFLLRIPEGQRAEFRASAERVAKAVEIIYTNRVLAFEARRVGIDKDPLISLRAKHVEEAFLAQAWQLRHQETMAAPDMIARARELYLLNPERFREPDRLTGEYVQISLVGRTRETAHQRAQEARKELLAGTPFSEILAKFSDDQRSGQGRGRLENVTPKDIDKALADAAFALSVPGQVSEAVEAGAALHLVRLERKVPSRVKAFEEVRDALVAEQLTSFKGLETDRRIGELKNTDKTRVFEANISELVRPLSPAALEAAQGGVAK